MKPPPRHIPWSAVARSVTLAAVVLAAVALLWFLVTRSQTSPERLRLPPPESVWGVLTDRPLTIAGFAATTWYRVVVGLVLGSGAGLAVGLLMTWSAPVERVLDPLIELVRPIPPIALIPFLILWFGIGDLPQLFLVALGCFMVIVVTTVVSVRNVPPVYARAARSLGASDAEVYRTVYLPAIVPALLAGLRVAAATGFGLTAAAEYLGAEGGLGYLIRNARTVLQTEAVMLAAILLGLESLLTDLFIRYRTFKRTAWVPRREGDALPLTST